ncbi:MAG TPA: FAD-dependent oxidoreductase [Solirubrobacteraceae bacterium]|nr:FAD-dependent oxidoreductase [Solirubrobacteraceae bacterium]
MSARRVIVLGGGLAGIAAALDCAEAGAKVTLLEVRPRLGGAAYSFQRDGLWLDNGQHVFLRCCTAYRGLLARLGSEQRVALQPRLEIPVLSPGRRGVVLRRNGLPAPLHLAGALLGYSHLTLAQRLSAARAALALGRLDLSSAAGTLGEWLTAHGQDAASVAALWDLIVLPTLNLPAAKGSLALGAFVLQMGLLRHNDAGDIGFHMRPLSETLGDPAALVLGQAGVDVRLGVRVEALERVEADTAERVVAESDALRAPSQGPSKKDNPGGAGRQARGGGSHLERRMQVLRVRAGGEELEADTVVCALPHERASALLRPLLGSEASRWSGLGASPIVNVHIVYDRRVCHPRFAAGVGTPVQYVFDRSEAVGLSDGQYLAISISGAAEEMELSSEQLRERYMGAMGELFPRARDAVVRSVHVSREHAATFAARPGTESLRPGPRTSVAGLVMAGAWTDTGWPATLEGAVLSGHAAAREALA